MYEYLIKEDILRKNKMQIQKRNNELKEAKKRALDITKTIWLSTLWIIFAIVTTLIFG